MYRAGSWFAGRRKKTRSAPTAKQSAKKAIKAHANQAASDRIETLAVRAKRMQWVPTPTEALAAKLLLNLKIPFRPQVVIGPYIVDFLLTNRCAVLEIDGSVHDTPKQQAYDRQRNQYFIDLGFHVVRVRSDEIETLGADLAGVKRVHERVAAEIIRHANGQYRAVFAWQAKKQAGAAARRLYVKVSAPPSIVSLPVKPYGKLSTRMRIQTHAQG